MTKSVKRHIYAKRPDTVKRASGIVRLPISMAMASFVAAPSLLLLGGDTNDDFPPVVIKEKVEVLQEAPRVEPKQKESQLEVDKNFSKLVDQLYSADRVERKKAAEFLSQSNDSAVARLASALLEEIRLGEETTEDLVAKLNSQDPKVVADAEQKLLERGDEAIASLLSALKSKEVVLEKKVDSEKEQAVTVEPVEQVSQESVEADDVKGLIAKLAECSSHNGCDAMTRLLALGEEAHDELIQAVVEPNKRIRTLAKMILTQSANRSSEAPFFHNYDDVMLEPTKKSAPVKKSVAPVATVATPSLHGTRWKGSDSDGESFILEFGDKGQLSYTNSTGSFDNGSWSLEGNAIHLSMNNGYATYRGIVGSETMSGKAHNESGTKWFWEFELQ